MRALGIDVGVRKGLDLVLLGEQAAPIEARRRVAIDELPGVVGELAPDVVAVDGPPRWALGGRSRLAEREIRWFGIQSFGTPSDPGKARHPFHEWMTASFAAYSALAESFPLFDGGPVRGHAIEAFPHATAVVLAGCLPPPDVGKREWRVSVLTACGIEAGALRSADQVDAALAALTGLYALRGRFTAFGDPRDGRIVLPAKSLPAQPYRRCHRRELADIQPPLPGLARCGCGDPECDRSTSREFAPGHDAKRKSMLWERARTGDEAAQELRERGWEPPPEMR